MPLALIMGCGGIAMACARRLGQDHRLILADRDDLVAKESSARLSAEGHSAKHECCDVSDASSVRALARALRDTGPLHVLAHVVGLSPSSGDARAILRVNATGAATIADSIFPLLRPGGSAVFMSSLGGHIVPADATVIAALDNPLDPQFCEAVEAAAGASIATSVAYAWSKIALMRMCQRLAPEWGKAGVRINSVSPGLIDSPMGQREFVAEPRKHALLQQTPLARQGSMIEIADAVEFLCSSRASFITGTDLLVDGGLLAVLQPICG